MLKGANTLTPNTKEFDRTQLEKVLSACNTHTIEKGEYLVRAGSVCKNFFYVQEGLLRQFSIDERGKEHNIQFAPEQWIIGDRERMFDAQETVYFFQALEHTTYIIIDPEFMNDLALNDASFAAYNNQQLHKHIMQLQKRINMLLSATAEERYLDFVDTYPNLTLRISQVMIASYLGITPESLSRVRKELAQRHSKKTS